MDCREIREELSAYIDGVLAEPLARKVEAHLKACPGCAAEVEEIREVVGMVRALGDIEPPEEFRGQVMARLRGEGGSAAAGIGRFIRRGQFIAAAAVLVLGIGMSMLWAKGYNPLLSMDKAATNPEKAYSLAEAPEDMNDSKAGGLNNESQIAYNDGAIRQEKGLTDNLQTGEENLNATEAAPSLPKLSMAAGAERAQLPSRSTVAQGNDDALKVVSEGSLRIDVSNMTAADSQVDKIAADLGGRVERDEKAKILRLVVPGGEFDRAMADLGKVGRVIDRQINTRDVTNEYNDLGTRIASLEMKEKQLAGQAENTFGATGTAGVEEDLRKTREELALLREQLAGLESAVKYAVITLGLNEQG